MINLFVVVGKEIVIAYLFAFCAIALWSTNAVTASFVLQILPVEQVQFLQFLGAFLVFAVLRKTLIQADQKSKSSKTAWLLGIIGLTGTMIFQYIAFAIGPITESNIIAYAWPLIATIFVILTGTAHRPLLLLCLAIVGFLGACLVIGGNQIIQLKFTTNSYGFIAAIASALCMAVYSFGIGRSGTSANDVLLPGAIVGLIITAIWCFLGESYWENQWALIAGFYLGVGPMGIGFLFWSWAMQKDPSGNTALLGFLTPITSTSLLLLNGEVMDTTSIIGTVIVLGCCTLIGLRSSQVN